MKKKLNIFLIIALLSATQFLFSQQDIMLSQYMFNGLLLNPAYAGSHKYTSASALYRSQWTDFDGAPKTASLLVDGPFQKEKMGLGLIIANDKIGISSQTDVYANYAYRLRIGKGRLGLGLKAGVSNYNAKYSTLSVWDADDVSFMADARSALIPKLGFGAYYNTDKLYAGFSIPSLLVTNPLNNTVDLKGSAIQRKHYYFTVGYLINAGEFITLKPSVLLKYSDSNSFQADANLNILFYDTFWLGCSYRTNDAIVALAEYRISSKLRIGYAFDYTISKLKSYSGYTHEVMLAFDFRKESIKTINPRNF